MKCTYYGCKNPRALGRALCHEHLEYHRAKAAERRAKRSNKTPPLKLCKVELRSIGQPPWPEVLVDSWGAVDHQNGGWRMKSEERRNPDRPQQWHEAIHLRHGVVLWRSVKPVERLRPLLQQGERLVLAVRVDANANYTRVRRYWL